MKKRILALLLVVAVLFTGACTNKPIQDKEDTESVVEKTTISGSFTVSVRDVIPDYVLDGETPSVAVVTQFQCRPFTLYVGDDIGSKLEEGRQYVFTIEPFTVEYPGKEFIRLMDISSMANEFPGFRIIDFRFAEEGETGMGSLYLTIE